jgi:TIR domain-containing protein
MSFQNACFISYRNGGHPGTAKLYESLCSELFRQTDLYLPKRPVFLDQQRLSGGDIFPQKLALELCRSTCLVMFFSPEYFDREHTYCAREYAGMVHLEGERGRRCETIVNAAKGLIIPVVIRGELPAAITQQRQCYTLADDLLEAGDVRRRRVRKVLADIARDIYERHQMQRTADLDGICQGFTLPTDADVAPLLDTMASGPGSFPWQ